MFQIHLFESENFTTNRARELGPVPEVHFHVRVQMVLTHEALVANRAFVFFVAEVDEHVFFKVVPHRERFRTLGARENLCVLVGLRVMAAQLFRVRVVDVARLAAPSRWTSYGFFDAVNFLVMLLQGFGFVEHNVALDALPVLDFGVARGRVVLEGCFGFESGVAGAA